VGFFYYLFFLEIDMKIYQHATDDIKDWYICNGFIKGRRVFGFGRTHYEALLDALSECKIHG